MTLTRYSLSPAWIVLNYNWELRTHRALLPCLPASVPTPGDTPTLNKRGGGTINWTAAILAYASLFKFLLSEDSTIASADFWSQPTPDDDPVWINSTALNIPGAGAGSVQPAAVTTMTFRTIGGHLLKLLVCDPQNELLVNLRIPAPYPASVLKDFTDYIVDTGSWVVGRDGTYPAVSIAATTKYNDALLHEYGLI